MTLYLVARLMSKQPNFTCLGAMSKTTGAATIMFRELQRLLTAVMFNT